MGNYDKKRELIAGVFFLVLLTLAGCTLNPAPLLSKLEKSNYLQLTSSPEISGFLQELSERNDVAEKVTIGKSALGSPVEALLVSKEINQFTSGHSSHDKMTVMLIGSQHGMEPSGAEALLVLARDIVAGGLRSYLEDMNFIFIPNSNPDGRNSNRRVNGNGVNLSTNFTILSEPESRTIIDTLYTWKPEVVLDVHESAILKKKTLARQGFLIDFEAQFEAANNPNVDSEIRAFSFEQLLPEIIALVKAQGLSAQRYIGEITNIHQTITHGGLSLRNLRNLAGVMGAFSFLLESRLDPSTGRYPTPRNIRERVAKQYLCITSFLQCCRTHRTEIISISRNARLRWKDQQREGPLYRYVAYVPDENHPQIAIPLRKLETNEPVTLSFRYHGAVEYHSSLSFPEFYLVTAHQELMKDFLERHHINYEVVKQPTVVPVRIKKIMSRRAVIAGPGQNYFDYSISEHNEEYTLQRGDLLVRLDQPARRLIPLFLEPQAISSIFNVPEYSQLVKEGTDFFIYRVDKS